MKIKKAILNTIMVITLTIIFASCKKDEPITPVEPPIIPIISLEEFKSATRWELDSLHMGNQWIKRVDIKSFVGYDHADIFPKENYYEVIAFKFPENSHEPIHDDNVLKTYTYDIIKKNKIYLYPPSPGANQYTYDIVSYSNGRVVCHLIHNGEIVRIYIYKIYK